VLATLYVPIILGEKEEDEQISISKITLSEPTNVKGAYTVESGPNFRGFYNDRAYVTSAGGQFYFYDTKKKTTLTYENLVREAFVDKLTGNVLFTRENIEENGRFSVYRALKEYPVKEVILDISKSVVLEDVTFFKDFAVLAFYDNTSTSPFVKVVSMKGTDLSSLGTQVKEMLMNNLTHTATDGERLIAYDRQANAVVELTSGTKETLFPLTEEVYGLSLGVYAENVLTSYSSENNEGRLLLNGQPLVNRSFAEIEFYNEDYVFVNTGKTLEFLQISTKQFDSVDEIAYNLSTTNDALYYSSEEGDIKQIKIQID
jgi:hypothetical protein